MSKVAEKVADSLYRKDYISEEEKEIYSYGYEILIDNIGKNFSVTNGRCDHSSVSCNINICSSVYHIAKLLWRLPCIKSVAMQFTYRCSLGNGDSWNIHRGSYEKV